MLLISHVKIVMMVLVFIFGGEVRTETKGYDTQVQCALESAKRIKEIQGDPRFDGGLGAWCVELPGQHS